MSLLKRMTSFFATLFLALSLVAAPTWASENPDNPQPQPSERMGSIMLLLGDGSGDPQTDMIGGTVVLYRIATVDLAGGAHYDVSRGQFASHVSDIAGLDSIAQMSEAELDAQNESLSAALEKAVGEYQISPVAQAQIIKGKATFVQVVEGLYLACQPVESQGYLKMNAFVISVPGADDQLEVVAQPKSGIYDASSEHQHGQNEEEEHEDNPSKPDNPGGPDNSGDSGNAGNQGGSSQGTGTSSGQGTDTSSGTGTTGTSTGTGTTSTGSTSTPGSTTSSTGSGKPTALRVPSTGDTSVRVTNYVLLGLAAVILGLAIRRRVRGGE